MIGEYLWYFICRLFFIPVLHPAFRALRDGMEHGGDFTATEVKFNRNPNGSIFEITTQFSNAWLSEVKYSEHPISLLGREQAVRITLPGQSDKKLSIQLIAGEIAFWVLGDGPKQRRLTTEERRMTSILFANIDGFIQAERARQIPHGG